MVTLVGVGCFCCCFELKGWNLWVVGVLKLC